MWAQQAVVSMSTSDPRRLLFCAEISKFLGYLLVGLVFEILIYKRNSHYLWVQLCRKDLKFLRYRWMEPDRRDSDYVDGFWRTLINPTECYFFQCFS